jgi:ADP-ribose pyrophosphatase YjhB (NUDIX family)
MAMLVTWLRRAYERGLGGAGRQLGDGRPGLCTPRFPIGAATLIRDEQGRILLVQQTYRSSSIWLPPGGWVDRGETPQEAARREAREEVGLQVAVGQPLAVGGGGYGEITILFEGHLLGEPFLTLSDEIERADFFSPDALPPLADQTARWLSEAFAALGTDTKIAPHI